MPAPPSLILFARVPVPGRVKTRLAGRLTDRGAADLYAAFLEDAGRVYLRPSRWTSVLCADPDGSDPRIAGMFPAPWRLETQAKGALGERLREAFQAEFERGACAAVAVGSDHPALPRKRLEEVFAALDGGCTAALIPAEDGGYCAIGLNAAAPLEEIFRAIPWSTETVLAETVARLAGARLPYRILEPAYDVDRPEDLDRLRRDLDGWDAAADDYPEATARALAALAITT